MPKLLIVVDMQNDFITGALGTPEARAIIPKAVEKIRSYLHDGDEIIFTLDTHNDNYLQSQEGQNLPIPHCIKCSDGWKLHPVLADFPGRRFEKPTFGSLACANYAAKGNYTQIELIGLCTDICVISNALLIKAALPETPVIVDSACCAGVTPQSHQTALDAMRPCQITII